MMPKVGGRCCWRGCRTLFAVSAICRLGAAFLLLLAGLAAHAVHAAEEDPKAVKDILESIKPNIDKAKAEFARKARIENEKLVAAIRKQLEAATKAGKLDEAVGLKAALDRAVQGEFLERLLHVDASDLLGDGELPGDVAVFSQKALGKSAWKTQGAVEFAKENRFDGAEVAILKGGSLVAENSETIRNGPVFIAMWLRYDSGVGGSLFGIAQENRDELSLLVAAGGVLGSYAGWPAAAMAKSAVVLPTGTWTYVACQWESSGMRLYLDGKDVGVVNAPLLADRRGRMEIGVNSPGGDEYVRLAIASLRIITGKVVAAAAVAEFMKADARKISSGR